MIALTMKCHFDGRFFSEEEFYEMAMEAARTIVRLPSQKIGGYKPAWPEYLPDLMGYGYNAEYVRKMPPTSKEIDRLDGFIDIMWKSQPVDVRIVMAVAFSAQKNGWPKSRGPAWTKVGRVVGLSKDALKTRFNASLERLRVVAMSK